GRSSARLPRLRRHYSERPVRRRYRDGMGIGTYELLNGNYYNEYVHIHLNGAKLKGEWSLLRGQKNGDREKWYLMKVGASMRAISEKRDDTSALSKRPLHQIETSADATWQSNRGHTP